MSAVRWGDVPTWVAAVATIIAVAGAWAAVSSELRAGRERDDDRRREQATSVAVWPAGEEIPDPQRAPRIRVYRLAAVLNNSSLPIYQVRIFITENNGAYNQGLDHFEVMRAAEYRELPLPDDRLIREEYPAEHLAMTFTDAAGLQWIRTGNGRLGAFPPA